MSLTLPVEEMSRLQVSFKVSLPDGAFSFTMAPSPTPCSLQLSGLKLNFQGTHDETGGVIFNVWASELPETSELSKHQEFRNPIKDLSECATVPRTSRYGSSNVGQKLSSTFPRLPVDSDPIVDGTDTMGPDLTPELAELFDRDSYGMDWAGLFMNDNLASSGLSPDTPYIPEIMALGFSPADGGQSSVSSQGTSPSAYDGASSSPDRVDTSMEAACVGSPQGLSAAECPSSESDFIPHSHSSQVQAGTDPSRPFKCLHPDCPLWFKRVYTRRVHMNTHLPGGEQKRKYGCSFEGCTMKFSRRHDRLRHTVGFHGMGTKFHCAPCSKYFSNQTTLERHHLEKHMPPGSF